MSAFLALPLAEPLRVSWPTPGRQLARTRANQDYGRPGWTRDCGRRFHRGCDIAPLHLTATGQTTTVWFTDCATGREYPSQEPTFVPHDPIACVSAGIVEQAVTDPGQSDFGCHVVVAHRWPQSGAPFLTLYGHLAEVAVSVGQPVQSGQHLGLMGQTSRSADARNWMLIAPHLHFEVRTPTDQAYDPLEFLQRYAD